MMQKRFVLAGITAACMTFGAMFDDRAQQRPRLLHRPESFFSGAGIGGAKISRIAG